ncbi:autotransporter outer membrane beta-barrel domain-containing protein [Escherichia coli O157:H7]|nr:autotransporter outer membrane beta-barrel domain-containing protein [Escherichia coli]QKA58845.1 autotransporter outer membrane beta-barrel domain-containing protein [Escherichia coli O157:H7]HAM8460449.1 autotransporter outer membrane beta-barrel domain-containing protein [Escherichia coli]
MNSEGGKPGNVLTVNGNYTGNNGLMTFNATLGGDNSPTDKMNVKGDTQGNTRVRVDNIGGVGAQTVNGIELIEVGGNSAGNFALTTGTVEAGAYVYTLAKGKGNDEKNWYLTSKWDGVTPADTPDPINNPPVVDPEGPSVYRPEAGSYISNIAAANCFDRRWNAERTVLLRLPQEDMCQTFGLPSSVKYESDGGPGIARIMAFLMGFSEALRDRYDFMKFQVFQWLIGATDGHAKNFSVFIQAGGSYRLTPFYDIISAFPVLGGTGIHISDLKLAMGLNASKGKKTAIDKIYPRHFLATAKVLRFPEVQMHEILSDFARMIPAALDNVKTSLPTDFPENVVTAVETNVLRLHGRLSREYGIK